MCCVGWFRRACWRLLELSLAVFFVLECLDFPGVAHGFEENLAPWHCTCAGVRLVWTAFRTFLEQVLLQVVAPSPSQNRSRKNLHWLN